MNATEAQKVFRKSIENIIAWKEKETTRELKRVHGFISDAIIKRFSGIVVPSLSDEVVATLKEEGYSVVSDGWYRISGWVPSDLTKSEHLADYGWWNNRGEHFGWTEYDTMIESNYD